MPEAVELVAGLRLDRVAPELHDLARGLRRLRAGQPLAHHQRDGVLHRRLRLLADLLQVGAMVAVLQHGAEIGLHAVHAARADRLAARLLDGVEDGARLPSLRREAAMHLAVVAGEPQRHGVADAARDRRRRAASAAAAAREGAPSAASSSGRSAANVTSRSCLPATARTQPATARLNGSVGASRFLLAIRGPSSAPRWRRIPAARRRARADRTPPRAAAPARRTCSGT